MIVKDSASGKTGEEESEKSPIKESDQKEEGAQIEDKKKKQRRMSSITEKKVKKDRPMTSLELIRQKQDEVDIALFNEKVEQETKVLEQKLENLTSKYQNALSKMVTCELLKGGSQLYTQRRNLHTTIEIRVKVFHGERKCHKFNVSILDQISVVMTLLKAIEGQEMQQYYVTKLVYPMGYLRNLSQVLNETFADQQIPDGAKLVLVGKRSFTWDPNAKGPTINLLNGNLTANKKQEVDYQTVLGSIDISSGVHYWEIKIEKFVELDDIIIGVSQKGIDLN